MKVTQITKSGKIVWRVYLGEIKGKKKYKQFPTKERADQHVRAEKIRKQRHGNMATRASAEQVAEYLELSRKLRKVDCGMREAVDFYLDHIEKTKKPTLLESAIKAYLADIKPTLSPKTVSDYRKRLNKFLRGRETLRVDESGGEVRDYLELLLKSYTRQTVDNEKRVLSAFFAWSLDRCMIAENPCAKIKSYLSKKKGKAKVFLPDEVEFLMTKIQENFDVRVAAYVVVSLFGGVRPQEFRKKITKNGKQMSVTLDWDMIDIKAGEVAVSEDLSKTNLYRVTQNETLQIWLKWIEEQSSEPLTGALIHYKFRHMWLAWRKKHVPELDFAPDILRHTFGTYRLKALASAGAVALEMGNSESIVKRHYLDARRSVADAESFWTLQPNVNTSSLTNES